MARDVSVGVNLIGRDISASKALNQLGVKAKSTGDILSSMSRKSTYAIAAFGAAAKLAIDAASDYGETVSKVGVIFGKQSDAIQKFANTAGEQLGLSKIAAMDAASTFAIFAKSAGLGGKDLVTFSTKLTGLASDLASFYNTSPEDAIVAIGAALRGENEPIRRYGVLLDDASLRQQAFAMHITNTTKKALTPQQKVLAAQALILKQTAVAQGDFQRTSSGLANQQRILAAEMTNMRIELGTALLPYMKELVATVIKMLPWIEKNKNLIINLGKAFLGVAVAIKLINGAYKLFKAADIVAGFLKIGAAASTAGAEGAAAGAAMSAAWLPLLGTILAVAAGLGLVVYAYKHWKPKQDNRNPNSYQKAQADNFLNYATSAGAMGSPTLSALGVPRHAKGGIVTRPHLGIVGEAGPEAIIPLNKSGMFGRGITINVAGSVIHEKDLAITVRDNIAQLMRRRGINPSPILGV